MEEGFLREERRADRVGFKDAAGEKAEGRRPWPECSDEHQLVLDG